MPHASTKIARRLLDLARNDIHSLTPLELIKMTYLAHGWSLGLRGEPLVDEAVQAWQYGPVFPELYHAIKHYRASPVQDVPAGASESFVANELTQDDDALVQAVYNAYKRFNGVQLSALTHQPGTPWSDTWTRYGKNTPIENDSIREHFKKGRPLR